LSLGHREPSTRHKRAALSAPALARGALQLPKPRDGRVQVAAVAVVLVLLVFSVVQYFALTIKAPWQLDFSDFYFAARTGMAHGWAQMYNTSVSMPALYAASGNWLPFLHPPVFAWVLAPLSLLPYPVALAIWDSFLVGCYLFCWRILASGSIGRRLFLLVAGLALYPVTLGLALGQPTMVVLAAVCLCYWFIGREQPLLAAAALSVIALKPQSSFLVPFALLLAGRVRVFTGWALFSMALAALCLVALGLHGLQDWRHAIEIGYRLPGIRFNSVASTIGPGVLAATINVLAGGIAVSIGRVAARRGAELPIAAGLSGSMLATPYLSVTDLAALLIAAWLILRLQPSRWLKALMMVGYLPFFFANEPHMHGPFLVLEGAWLIALLVFAVSLGVQRSTSPVMQVTMPPPTQIVPS